MTKKWQHTKLNIKLWIRLRRIDLSAWLMHLANRVDSDMAERFAFDYTHTHWATFEDWCWQKQRGQTYDESIT